MSLVEILAIATDIVYKLILLHILAEIKRQKDNEYIKKHNGRLYDDELLKKVDKDD